MKGLLLIGLLCVLILIGVITGVHTESASTSTPKTPQEIEDSNYESAAGACLLWAEKNGPIGFDEFIDDFQLPRRKGDPKNVYRAGLHYRGKGNGLLMRADCSTLLTTDGKVAILEARARVGQ